MRMERTEFNKGKMKTETLVKGLTEALIERETLSGKEARKVICEAIQNRVGREGPKNKML